MPKKCDRPMPRRPQPRSGAVVLELLLVIPINMIVLLAVAQFGLFLSNHQQLALACRTGAGIASESSSLMTTGNPVPMDVTDAVVRQLASSGIAPSALILEHVAGGGPATEQTLRTNLSAAGAACQEPANAIPGYTVRLTVCVPLSEMMPNCMSGFGFDTTGHTVECSTTFGRE